MTKENIFFTQGLIKKIKTLSLLSLVSKVNGKSLLLKRNHTRQMTIRKMISTTTTTARI